MNGQEQAHLLMIVRFMKSDIAREIEWYHSRNGNAGQFLCALGLTVYTEALGRIQRWNDEPEVSFFGGHGKSEELYKHYNAFFDALGPDHVEFRRKWEQKQQSKTDLYESLRSGLVHEYAPKVDTEIRMSGPSPIGLADENGVLIFEVEGYFRAFEKAADALVARLFSDFDKSSLPPVKYRRD